MSINTIKLISKEDYPQLSEFLEKMTHGVYSQAIWIDLFNFWWENNPYRPNESLGVILYGKENSIKGFFGCIAVDYSLKGKKINAYCGTSWYVDPEYRSQSLKLLQYFFTHNKPCLLLMTTANEVSTKIFTALRFKRLNQAWLKQEYYLPINGPELWDFVVNRVFTINMLPWISSPLKFLMGLAINFLSKIWQLKLGKDVPGYTFFEIDKFEQAYTSLWEKYKESFEILAIRDQQALNWFFFGSDYIRSNRKVLELRFRKELIGYVAINITPLYQKEGIFHYFDVVDMMLVNNEQAHYLAMLKSLLCLAKNYERKILFIKIASFDNNLEKHLSTIAFVMRKNRRFLYKCQGDSNDIMKNSLETGFYATPLDGDRGFFIS